MSNIFISYRRTDSGGHSGWLNDMLSQHFSQSRVFFDVDSIPVGQDFLVVINRYLQKSNVVLVMIGNGWLVKDQFGRTRLSDPNDHVRVEIVAALNRKGVIVIPILVQGMKMPQAQEVPADLAPLLRLNAYELRDRSWNGDVRGLIRLLESHVGKPARTGAAKRASRVRTKAAASDQTPKKRPRRSASTSTQAQKAGSQPGSQQPVTTAEARAPKKKPASPRAEGTGRDKGRAGAKASKQSGTSGPEKQPGRHRKSPSTKNTASGRAGAQTSENSRTPQAPKAAQGAAKTTPKRGSGNSAAKRAQSGVQRQDTASGASKSSRKSGGQTPKRAAAKSTGNSGAAAKAQAKKGGATSPRNSRRGGGRKS